MRATIHLVSARDYWPFALAVEKPRRDWWIRVQRDSPAPRKMAAAARRLRAALADGPLRRAEVEALLGRARARGVGMWIHLVRVPPSGTWERRRADLYGDAEAWLGPPAIAPAEALEHLVRRYLGAFGPASGADVASWSGLPPATVTSVLGRLPLRRLRSEDGEGLVDLPRAPLPGADTRAPVRFLPTWDATLLTHVRRTGLLPEEYRPRIFNTKMPQSVGTFLVDGSVAGTWRHEEDRIRLEPFHRLDPATRRELDEEAERLDAFHA
jgi:hypothetical protein